MTAGPYSLLTLPIPRETTYGSWVARVSPGGVTETCLLLFTQLREVIFYEGTFDTLEWKANIASKHPLTKKRIAGIIDEYLDIGYVELAQWEHDTGWILDRRTFAAWGRPLPDVPQPVSVESWRKHGEVWF